MRLLLGLFCIGFGLFGQAAPVLVIGDSISVGYTPVVTTLLFLAIMNVTAILLRRRFERRW